MLKAVAGGSSGAGQVIGLVYNSTTAAAANTSVIQNALNSGGNVSITAPSGSVIYINATLTIPSNTTFVLNNGVTLRALAGTGALLQNTAVTTSWTTLYNNSGLVTNGPLSMIWSNNIATWAGSTGYSRGAYASNGGNLYWCATTGTSAAAGGPTGTGTAIVDGSCTWNYVTVAATENGGKIKALINWPSHGKSVGDEVWVTPKPDGGIYGNYWSGTGSANQVGGPCDSAFFGVFTVLGVNDSNWITVNLWRPPAVGFSGIPVNIKAADQNISIQGGGTWDYNYPTNTGGGYVSAHGIVMGGVNKLYINGVEGANAAKYNLTLCGVKNAGIYNMNTRSSISDRIKVYGPSFNIDISDSGGSSGDDIISIQTQESTTFYSYIIACGDIIGVRANNISAENSVAANGGGRVIIYPSHQFLFTDQITFSNIQIESVSSAVSIFNYNAPGTGSIGTVNIQNCGNRDFAAPLLLIEGTSAIAVGTVNIENSGSSSILSANNYFMGGQLLKVNNSLATLNVVNVKGCNLVYGSTTGFSGNQLITNLAGSVNQLNVNGCNINYVGQVSNSTIVTSAGTGIKNFNLENCYITGSINYLVSDSSGMNMTFRNIIANSISGGVSIGASGAKLFVQNCNITPNNLGLLRFNSGFSFTLTSGGGNNLNGQPWVTYPVAGTLIPYGFDIQTDVTKTVRTSGAYFFNTNTAPGSGTLNTAGPVMCQGTAANSWFLVANPSGQQY